MFVFSIIFFVSFLISLKTFSAEQQQQHELNGERNKRKSNGIGLKKNTNWNPLLLTIFLFIYLFSVFVCYGYRYRKRADKTVKRRQLKEVYSKMETDSFKAHTHTNTNERSAMAHIVQLQENKTDEESEKKQCMQKLEMVAYGYILLRNDVLWIMFKIRERLTFSGGPFLFASFYTTALRIH